MGGGAMQCLSYNYCVGKCYRVAETAAINIGNCLSAKQKWV